MKETVDRKFTRVPLVRSLYKPATRPWESDLNVAACFSEQQTWSREYLPCSGDEGVRQSDKCVGN